jgi:hypothetical protein
MDNLLKAHTWGASGREASATLRGKLCAKLLRMGLKRGHEAPEIPQFRLCEISERVQEKSGP